MVSCHMCGGPTEGFKCAACGAESATHDPRHECGGDMVQPKCSGCNEAQDNCTCNGQ